MRKKFLKKVNGSVVVLTQGANGHHNYAHWLLDIVPKMEAYIKFTFT